jgi:hypothetical protein
MPHYKRGFFRKLPKSRKFFSIAVNPVSGFETRETDRRQATRRRGHLVIKVRTNELSRATGTVSRRTTGN